MPDNNFSPEVAPPPIEYRPNLLDRAAGLAGKLMTPNPGSTNYPLPEGYTLLSLLDSYEASGQQPELDVWSEYRDDPYKDAGPLLGLLATSPQLHRPLFIRGLSRVEQRDICTIKADYYEWAQLPVRNFVAAPGLENWNRGRSHRSSRRKIRNFARRSDPAPPIDLVSANVQPNGVVLYQLLRDGAHRVAAAHLRGDKEIAVASEIFVNRLAKDLVPKPQKKQ